MKDSIRHRKFVDFDLINKFRTCKIYVENIKNLNKVENVNQRKLRKLLKKLYFFYKCGRLENLNNVDNVSRQCLLRKKNNPLFYHSLSVLFSKFQHA